MVGGFSSFYGSGKDAANIHADNEYEYWGTDNDGALYFDGTNFYIRTLINSAHIILLPSNNGQVRIGDAGIPSRLLGSGNDDLFISGSMECDSFAYFDGFVYINAGARIITDTSFGWGSSLQTLMRFNSFQTPDCLTLGIDETSRNFLIVDRNDVLSGDYGHAANTNPTLFIHSATGAATATNEWLLWQFDGSNAVFNVGKGTLQLAAAGMWTANGANTVTISNVAPAGVGTATISQWLTLIDNNGITYYIPAWT